MARPGSNTDHQVMLLTTIHIQRQKIRFTCRFQEHFMRNFEHICSKQKLLPVQVLIRNLQMIVQEVEYIFSRENQAQKHRHFVAAGEIILNFKETNPDTSLVHLFAPH